MIGAEFLVVVLLVAAAVGFFAGVAAAVFALRAEPAPAALRPPDGDPVDERVDEDAAAER